MAFLDFDRDGWRDILLVNANAPQLVIYKNQFGKVFNRPARTVAIKLRGGSRGTTPGGGWSNRDGYGAVVTVETAGLKQSRELRCGEGFASQNSSTIVVGLGDDEVVEELKVHWPSGREQVFKQLPAGSEVQIFENPSESTDSTGLERIVSSPGRPSEKVPVPGLAGTQTPGIISTIAALPPGSRPVD